MAPFISADLKIYVGTGQDNQVVLVSPALWTDLQGDTSYNDNSQDSKTVSIKIPSLVAPTPFTSSRSEPLLESFIAYVKPHSQDIGDERVVYASSHLIKAVYGPDALSKLNEEEDMDDEEGDVMDLRNLDSVCSILVEPISLIELDELIIGALDSDSFNHAQQKHESLIQLIKESQPALILRSGGIYHLDGFSFQVLMSSPVQQGHILSDRTKIYIVDMPSSPSSTGYSTPMNDSMTLTTPSFPILSGSITSTSIATLETAEPQEFTAHILKQKWPEARLFPTPHPTEDDDNRVFIDVKDLAKCHVFSGDWVLASANDSKKSRLCRVYGIDGNNVDDDNDQNGVSAIYLPPVLYYNLGLPLPPAIDTSSTTTTTISSDSKLTVCLTRLTKPPPKDGPPLATAVSVARIASPSLMDKSLQSAFLQSLKQWFESKERIVCKGDVIAITLDEEQVRLKPHNNDNEDEDDDLKLHTNIQRKPTTMGYFKVTNLTSEQEVSDDDHSIHPAFYGSGRRIDPSQTQLVQTGVEQSRVPIGCISHYYDLAEKLPLYRSTTAARASLMELITSSLHPLGRDFEVSCNALLQGPKGGGKSTLVREVVEDLGVHVYEFSVYDIISDTDAKTELHLRAKFEKASSLAPCVILIRGIEGLAKKSAVVETGQEPLLATVLQECIKNVNQSTSGFPVMVIATTSDVDQLPSSILGCFRHEVVIEAPDEKTRLQILKNLTHACPLAPDVSMSNLATQTAALVAKDLADLVARTGVLALQRIYRATSQDEDDIESGKQSLVTVNDIRAAGITLTAADFDAALSEARASYSDSIGAPKIPNVTWDDVGGLANVKDDILDTIQLPLEHPELFGSGLKKRSGILLYGPPGTGKTLLAKAIATSCSLNFFSVKGPELLNMYIGESEANVRRVFQRARDAKPCVIFFDELDSVAPKRGEKGDSGGVMDRIVSQLLAELDGMSEGDGEGGAGDVFVIGATNRPDLLDPALLRPGRFDKLLYLGVSQDHESQLRIIEALTRKFRLHPELDLARVAEKCPFHYTGADFYALCTDAMLKAMTRVAQTIEERVKTINKEREQPISSQYFLSHMATPDDIMVQVEEVDFVRALEELVPSVSATELAHYSKVREKFEKVQDEEEEKQKVEERELLEQINQQKIQPPKEQPSKKSKGKGKARA
ncbi:P-loop containing nucleoside triphosphate hydrolase protein [Halteromyces radiatus]|uniref:P-loop containing nucleoside triphosphate hydrolase protein n=1 Tax=Halteromyces radiatus TaxID=101107 RepID=UPI0022202BFC|nr:P-loop containing nucleoside triphosphate hydrolase protein [Halteromyces radiatus]KAI8085978.1 P-loop containing nucleoside triphosphate hydrolase protein [Halteromyces radiatus]